MAEFVYKNAILKIYFVVDFFQKQDDSSNTEYGAVTVGLMPSLKQISALSQEGEMTLDTAYEVTPGMGNNDNVT